MTLLLGLHAFLVCGSGFFRGLVWRGVQRHAFNLRRSLHHQGAHIRGPARNIEIHQASGTGTKTRGRRPQFTTQQLTSWNSHHRFFTQHLRLRVPLATPAGIEEGIGPRSQLHVEIAVRGWKHLLTYPDVANPLNPDIVWYG